MADISKITTTNGTTYNIKDAEARANLKVVAHVNYRSDMSWYGCDKTFDEIYDAIYTAGYAFPVVEFNFVYGHTVTDVNDHYLYFKHKVTSNNPEQTSLFFYELTGTGIYVEFTKTTVDGVTTESILHNTFEPAKTIIKGIVDYNAGTDTYSCNYSYANIRSYLNDSVSFPILVYGTKYYYPVTYSASSSSSAHVFVNNDPNSEYIEKFTYTSTGLSLTSEPIGGGTVDTVNGIQPDANKNVQVDVELTMSEYNALPSSKLTDDVNYWITDGANNPQNNNLEAAGIVYDNTDSGLTSTDVQGAVDELKDTADELNDAVNEINAELVTQEITEIISTGNKLYAIKTGNLVTLQTNGNGIAITTSGIQLPTAFAPTKAVKIIVPCYTNDWTYCRAEIEINGIAYVYNGSSKMSSNYVCLNVTYALGLGD